VQVQPTYLKLIIAGDIYFVKEIPGSGRL